MEGHPRLMSCGGEFWQNLVYRRSKWQTTLVFLPWEPHEEYENAKRHDTETWIPQVDRCSICYWRRKENKLQKERRGWAKMKNMPRCGCDWWWKKSWCCKKQYCIGTWNVRSMNPRYIESGQTIDRKSEHQHFRNQWTKMDWKGCIYFIWPL